MIETENAQDELAEEIEGLDDPWRGGGWGGDYPLDSVFVRQETRTVGDVLIRIDRGRYVLDPDFQRDFVWSEDRQSRLIESCVMRIPLPVFYVAEARDGRIVIVDGLQRLTTFSRYVTNKFKLRGLGTHEENAPPHPLEGRTFSDLPLNLQERILDTQLIMYILDDKAPERARLDIFERVNSGVPLSRQQMRNALYNGPATKWLKAAAESPLFREVTGRSLDPRTMRDREAINRFCAFKLLGWADYRGDMDAFLATTLKTMNDTTEPELSRLRDALDRSLTSNRELFGAHAFRKSLAMDDPTARRNILNMALFEVCMVLLAQVPERLSRRSPQGQQIRRALMDLVHDERFSLAITYSTNSTRAVTTRFEMAQEALRLSELML
jgi:Protein of unknown function DUF262